MTDKGPACPPAFQRGFLRLEDFSTVIVCTERFVEACQRLGLDGVSFHPLPAP